MMPIISTQQLTIQHAQKRLCHQLTADFYSGEIWGILGKNGAGKTTLIKTLAGLHQQYQGEIFLKDRLLTSHSILNIAKHLAVVLQHYEDIFPQTVWEYSLYARYPRLTSLWQESRLDKDFALQILTQFELDTMLHKKMSQLSGGERQRLELAAAIIQQPNIYLLDEPTNHLDIHHQHQVLKYFKNLAKEGLGLVIMALHDINHAERYCDRILLLGDDGECILGETSCVLTALNLSKLYSHPIVRVEQGEEVFWVG